MVDVPDGPLQGLGTISVMNEAAAHALADHAGLVLTDVQTRSRTAGAERALVEELVLLAHKPV